MRCVINDKGIEELSKYKTKAVSQLVGIAELGLREIKYKRKPILRLPAYALTKFMNSEAELDDYFTRAED